VSSSRSRILSPRYATLGGTVYVVAFSVLFTVAQAFTLTSTPTEAYDRLYLAAIALGLPISLLSYILIPILQLMVFIVASLALSLEGNAASVYIQFLLILINCSIYASLLAAQAIFAGKSDSVLLASGWMKAKAHRLCPLSSVRKVDAFVGIVYLFRFRWNDLFPTEPIRLFTFRGHSPP
jgi:hypothetical protein